MSDEGSISVMREATVPYAVTQGTPAEALTSHGPDDEDLWNEAIESMLDWRSDPTQFAPEDQPDFAILDTAIDYAMDSIPKKVPAPSSVAPSGSGRVSFEWHAGNDAVIFEIVRRGEAEYTRFAGGNVVRQGRFIRNPMTRKLELES